MPDFLAKVDVSVLTVARPVAGTLLAARTVIKSVPEIQALFRTARTHGWSAGELADSLYIELPQYLLDPVELWETCLHLADEFTQMGDSTLLVSRETGIAIARIQEDDIYLPAPVSRETEDGSIRLAQPLPRIRPGLEGLIVQWQFDRARDKQVVQGLSDKLPTSQLLVQGGDGRLLQVTQGGRKKIVDRLRDELPTLLHGEVPGVSGQLLRLCKFGTVGGVPSGFVPCSPSTSLVRVVRPVLDPVATNLRQDAYTVLQSQIRSGWVRDIARVLSGNVHGINITLGEVQDASVFDTLPDSLWIADPNTAMALRGKLVLPVPGATPTLVHSWLDAPVAYICIREDSYSCQSREFLERWEVGASLEYTLHLNPKAFTAYRLKDVPESGLSVEVMA